MSPHASLPPTTLRGHWLLFARVAWVVVAIMALAIVVFSIPSSFEHYSSVCTTASEVCSERAVDQPTPEGVRALHNAGLSVHTYALLNVVVDKVFQLVWLVVGVLIFWRRSDDRMALLVSMFLHQRSRAALASVRYRRPHKPHPRLRLSHGHANRTLLRRHRGAATSLRRPHRREVHPRGGGLHSRDSSPVQTIETAHTVVHR
jgi:hypothetical protein